VRALDLGSSFTVKNKYQGNWGLQKSSKFGIEDIEPSSRKSIADSWGFGSALAFSHASTIIIICQNM
jgi:hypothetical protein